LIPAPGAPVFVLLGVLLLRDPPDPLLPPVEDRFSVQGLAVGPTFVPEVTKALPSAVVFEENKLLVVEAAPPPPPATAKNVFPGDV
jgi:hypothetical protein